MSLATTHYEYCRDSKIIAEIRQTMHSTPVPVLYVRDSSKLARGTFIFALELCLHECIMPSTAACVLSVCTYTFKYDSIHIIIRGRYYWL